MICLQLQVGYHLANAEAFVWNSNDLRQNFGKTHLPRTSSWVSLAPPQLGSECISSRPHEVRTPRFRQGHHLACPKPLDKKSVKMPCQATKSQQKSNPHESTSKISAFFYPSHTSLSCFWPRGVDVSKRLQCFHQAPAVGFGQKQRTFQRGGAHDLSQTSSSGH